MSERSPFPGGDADEQTWNEEDCYEEEEEVESEDLRHVGTEEFEVEVCSSNSQVERCEDEDFWRSLEEHLLLIARQHSGFPFVTSPWSVISADERFFRVCSAVEAVITLQMDLLEEEDEDEEKLGGGGGGACAFVYPNLSSWENVRFDPLHGLVPVSSDIVYTRTALRHKGSARKFSHILLTLQKIWDLCIDRSFSTKRDLYYQNVSDYTSQSDVDSVVTVISAMLQIPRLQLRILSTTKGLVAGSLSFVSEHGESIDLSTSASGISVPQDVEGVTGISSDAKFILVVEKDATFQRLLDEGFLHSFRPCILVTGRGVPDLNTRQFVFHLWRHVGVPIFTLVDADPFGVEIMCAYRFGSLAMAWTCERTAVPTMRWLGVHPTDFDYLPQQSGHQRLTTVDRAKIASLLKRPYMDECPALKAQLDIMKEKGIKAEIQAFPSTSDFVREKIRAREWI